MEEELFCPNRYDRLYDLLLKNKTTGLSPPEEDELARLESEAFLASLPDAGQDN